MSNLYESLARTLHELDLSSLKDTESIISYENEKIQIEFTQVTENPKNILRKIREKLLERESIFDFIVIINGKNYRLKYPTVVDRLKSLDYKILYKDVVYRATIISSAILFVMLYFTTLVTIPVTRVNMVTDNVVNASGLVSALLITYLISKTFAIRQEKLNRVPRIKELSGKLSAFRKLCHSLVSCPSFFEKAAREESHARTIALKIDFNDVHYLDFADKERFRYVGNLMNYDIYSEPLTNFFLQLHTFCMNRHLTFYYKDAVLMEDANSSNYVYSSKELERWQSLADNNLFWYIFDHEKQDYEHLFNFDIPRYNLTKIRKYAGQIEPNTGASAFDKDVLIHISQFVGYDVIPELTLMVRKNEAGPSRLIRYFFSTVTLVFTFGVIMPTLSSLFIPDKCINLVCVMVVIAVIIHILLCLPTILREELTLHPTYDYI